MRWEQEERGTVAWISGEIDHHGAKQLLHELDGRLETMGRRNVTADLSGVSFMDSSGIAVLLRLYRRVGEVGGRVTVRGAPEQTMKVLRAAGITKLMKFE